MPGIFNGSKILLLPKILYVLLRILRRVFNKIAQKSAPASTDVGVVDIPVYALSNCCHQFSR